MQVPGTGAGSGGTPWPGHGRAGGYLLYVDGLRALAVLAVIVYHLDPSWLPGGFTGVDVFFVISGFVVSVCRLPHASVWDPLPSLCDATSCAAMRNGRPLFFDADHLSGYGNRVLLPGFSAHLRAVTAPPSPR